MDTFFISIFEDEGFTDPGMFVCYIWAYIHVTRIQILRCIHYISYFVFILHYLHIFCTNTYMMYRCIHSWLIKGFACFNFDGIFSGKMEPDELLDLFSWKRLHSLDRQLQEASSSIGLDKDDSQLWTTRVLVEGLEGLSWVLGTQGWWEEYLFVFIYIRDITII